MLTWPTQRRVIINTDAKNEADDQYAIVHALLSPSLDVRGVIAGALRHLAQRPEHERLARRRSTCCWS